MTALPIKQSFTIPALHAAYAAGVDVRDVISQVRRRLNEVDDPGIFIARCSDEHVAQQIDDLGAFDATRYPLWGIPFAVKDNIDVAQMPTTAACPAFAYEATEDAQCVKALREAGAILIGKTNLDQFATGLVGMRTPHPAPRNAIDPSLVPGGSSSGSAVSVAHGIVSFSLGTDTAGSGRVPAALNNIIGLKPSLGMISARGVVPACRTLDTVSVFALTVQDAQTVRAICTGFDASDPFSRRFPLEAGRAKHSPVRRLGVIDAQGLSHSDDDVIADYNATVGQLHAFGLETTEIDLQPFYEVATLLYRGAWVAERFTVIEALLDADPDAVFPTTRTIIERARTLSAADSFRDIYRLQALRRQCLSTLEGLDAIVVPTIPGALRIEDHDKAPLNSNDRLGTYTNFVNLLDLCALAVPVASGTKALTASVTLIARAGADDVLAHLGARLHATSGGCMGATDWPLETHAPSVVATDDRDAAPAANELAVAVVGAHLSGMALNHQLTDRAARLVSKTKTAACYRLFALAGGPPLRPGLIRDSASGEAIEVELWSMPEASIGSFLAGIPAPLGLGRITLEDGTDAIGFICESAGVSDAIDITEYRGWRHYINSLNQAHNT